MADEEEALKKEEARLFKSLSRGGSKTTVHTKQAEPALHAAKPEPKPVVKAVAKEVAKPAEAKTEKKEVASSPYVSTADRLEKGGLDHREGVVSDSAVSSLENDESPERDLQEEHRLEKNLGKTAVNGISESKRQELEKKEKVRSKLEERMQKLGVKDYSSNFV